MLPLFAAHVVRLLALVVLPLAACAQHPVVTEIAYVIDESEDCLSPDANEFQAIPKAAALWAALDVTVAPLGDASEQAHLVAVCFVTSVPYDDAPEGWRAVGRVFRDDDGSRMLIEAGRSHADTTTTVAHEFGHVVTWSADHADGRGIFGVPSDGQEWSTEDLDHFAAVGL